MSSRHGPGFGGGVYDVVEWNGKQEMINRQSGLDWLYGAFTKLLVQAKGRIL